MIINQKKGVFMSGDYNAGQKPQSFEAMLHVQKAAADKGDSARSKKTQPKGKASFVSKLLSNASDKVADLKKGMQKSVRLKKQEGIEEKISERARSEIMPQVASKASVPAPKAPGTLMPHEEAKLPATMPPPAKVPAVTPKQEEETVPLMTREEAMKSQKMGTIVWDKSTGHPKVRYDMPFKYVDKSTGETRVLPPPLPPKN